MNYNKHNLLMICFKIENNYNLFYKMNNKRYNRVTNKNIKKK
jgi:hypothetical protein